MVLHAVPEPLGQGIAELAQALNAGQVETLVILGGNPVYNAPAELDWAKTQRKAKMVARLGYYEDETFASCDWHFPAAHYLESWGDALTSDGTLVPIQPLIAPLFGGLTELEVLARIAGATVTDPYSIVRETFAGIVGEANLEATWRKFLHDGFLAKFGGQTSGGETGFQCRFTGAQFGSKSKRRPKKNWKWFSHRHYCVDDGRYNNNGWLQELPDPVTKLVWDNAVLISRKTAAELGVKNSDVVEIQLGRPQRCAGRFGCSLAWPIIRWAWRWATAATKTGRVGTGTGFNAYRAAHRRGLQFCGRRHAARAERNLSAFLHAEPLVAWKAGRSFGKPTSTNIAEHPRFAKNMEVEEAEVVAPMYPNPFDELKKNGHPSMGHGHRPQPVRRLFGVHAGLPEREQRPDRRQRTGQTRPRDALAADRPLLLRRLVQRHAEDEHFLKPSRPTRSSSSSTGLTIRRW